MANKIVAACIRTGAMGARRSFKPPRAAVPLALQSTRQAGAGGAAPVHYAAAAVAAACTAALFAECSPLTLNEYELEILRGTKFTVSEVHRMKLT